MSDIGTEKVRVSKLMAAQGLCSRREADSYITRGWVLVDGVPMTELGTRVDPSCRITLAKPAEAAQRASVTVLINKPVGYVSGQPEPPYKPAITLVGAGSRFSGDRAPLRFNPLHLRGLAPAGRLDIDSQGLLVLTQDGRVARQLVGENSGIDKEYLVRIEGRLSTAGLAQLNFGLSLDGKALKRSDVRWQNRDQLQFILREGKKRQIRRMCELVGIKVTGLKRVRIGQIKLGDLPEGQWRYLLEQEKF